ncbi:SspB-related isopeptide-forming adhesin [Streptococcus pseudopneumoniae]|uniref:SspB-related isopeptide-forming adhesin n=4 Tax=Streptococcus TaxID=1301 RepID=UPI001419EB6C|nr:SspB-related isopeptide-forming adhesin [Streptococcus pseudopneumoniae]NIB94352.1 LPXTG cell wall anchor domain-containing protein [Streptococcus pseudopneumoniae]
MKFNNETRAFGSIRKTRRWGTCGVILGLAALGLMTSPVRADERVNPNPATNAKSLQDSPTVDSTKDQGSAEKSTGSVEITVGREKVESAVSAAKEAGLIVKETEVDGGLVTNSDELAKKTAEIESSYDKQAITIVDESEKYKKEVETRKEEIKTITTENKEKQDSYDKAKAQYDKDLADATAKNAQIDKENQEKNERLKAERERVAKENERIKQENALAKTNYEKALADKAKKDADIDKENADVKKTYEEALNKWTIEKGKSDAGSAKYKERLAKYEKDLEEYKRKLAELQTQRVQGRTNGVTIYGEFDESKRGSLAYYSKLAAIFDEDKDLEVVDGALGATKDTTMTLDNNLVEDTAHTTDGFRKYGGKLIKGIQKGSQFTLHNVGTTKSGKKISATFTSRSTPVQEHKLDGNNDVYTSLWVWWYKNGEAGPVSNVGFNPNNYLNVEWDINFFDESTKQPMKLGLINFYTDLDYNQGIRYTYDNNQTGVVVNPKDSRVKEVTVRGEKFWAGKKTNGVHSYIDISGLNRWEDGDPFYVDVDDEREVPVGSILSVGKGTTHHLTYLANVDKPLTPYSKAQSDAYRTYWNDDNRSHGKPAESDYEIFRSGYAFQLWGGRSVINQLGEPKPPLKESEPTKPRPLEPEYKEKDKTPLIPPTEKPLLASPKDEPDTPHVPTPSEPPTPDLKPVPNEVAPREVQVTYTRLRTTPTVEKLVKNSAGTDVNNSSVPKLSEVVWDLETKPLAANRKETTIYELTDNLPQGYRLDLAKTVDQNQDFTVTYDKDKHQLKGSLKAEGLVKVNTDLSKAYKTPVLKVYGTVTNDGATYKNNFHLNLNNEFESYSNIVKVSTPGKPNDPDNPNNNFIQPLKHNYNKDKVIIDGKPVLVGSTNYYHITLDYDQYKGMKADSSTILKGFGAIDDYPEEAVTINQSDIRYIDSEGQEVAGISVYQYDSIDAVDNDKVKAFLASSEIKPKGAFQVFLVDDAEAYFNQYIKSGKSVTIIDPMLTKEELRNTGKSFENTAYQVDFGNGYQTDTVVNNVPTVKPTKKNLNKAGVNIDGKQVLAGSVNYYTVTADYSQYKGIEADKDSIGKGFYIVDDYPEEAVTINQDGVQVTDSKGQVVKGLKMALYESLAKAPSGVQEAMKFRNFTPKGAIQVFEAENPEEFYKTYVQAGEVLTITNPMTVKKELGQTGGKYENTAYQLDFGSAYVTETVVNNVPTAKPTKKNLNKAGVNIDGKQVLAGSVNYYTVTADYSQYKGIEADKDSIGKGFYIVDDYPEEAVTINQDGVQVTDSKGQVVKGLKMALYESLDKVPTGVQEAMKSRNFTPKGAIQVFEAEKPEEFYKTYVQAGEVLTITNPMTVKKELGKTGGKYENTAYQLDFGMAYVTETVVNNVPTAKPTKKNLNKAGVNIDGKQVLAGSVNYYTVTADYSQYKGIEADKDSIGKGFYIVDDYPEEAVTINQDGVQVTDSKGQVVKGLKMALYESLDKAPTGVQEAMKSRNFTPKGAIQVFEAENPEEFYKTYVQAGEVLTITNPMTVKKELGKTGGKYENTAYQLDFGMAYVTETVVNNVPKIEPKKDVVIDHLSKESLDGKELKLNQTFNYKLVGFLIPKDRSEQLFEYQFSDDYDETHDEYQGVYQVFATVDFETSDGQKFKAGDELTKYTSQVVDKDKGKVNISFDNTFLKSILETSEFQAEVYLQMTRIQSGTVENTYSHTVNGVEVVSNTVVTHTPEEPKPEPKTPEEHPQEPKKPSLPNTGTASSMLGYVGSGILSMLGLVGIKRKKD